MADGGRHYTSHQKKKIALRSAKAKLRFCNFLIGVLCVVALAFLYIQPFFSVQVSYAVPPETLRQVLQEQMGANNLSEEDLEDVDLTLGFSLTIEGKGLSSLLGDELNALIRMGNGGGNGGQSGSSSGETQSPEDQTGSDDVDTDDQLSFFAAAYAAAQQDPSDSGQTSSDSGQTSSDSGQTSSDSGQTSSDITSSSDETSVSSGEETGESALLQRLLQACKDNEVVHAAISASVNELIAQAKAAVPRVVAIYVKVVVREQAQQSSTGTAGTDDSSSSGADSGFVSDDGSEDAKVDLSTVPLPSDSLATVWTARRPYAQYLSGGAVASSGGNDLASQIGNLDVDELTEKIEELLSKDSVTVAEAQKVVMDYVKENQDALGLTDDSIDEVEAQVGEALNSMAQQFGEPVVDENGDPVVDENGNPVMAIRPNEVVTDLLVQAGMVDKDKAESGAELSELLTDYIMSQMGEAEDVLYYIFMAFSLVLAVLYVLWGFLLIKSVIKIFTGTPMGAFFVKLLTGLPFLLLVLIPTIGLSVLGMEGILNMLASAGMGDLSAQLMGLSLAVSGGWVAFACTVVLFLFGFLYSSFKRKYKRAKKALE